MQKCSYLKLFMSNYYLLSLSFPKLFLYTIFSDLLPAALVERGGELQYEIQRQGKVLDYKFLLPTPEGPVPHLAELSVISAGRTWHPRGERKGSGEESREADLGVQGPVKDL